MRIYIGLMVAAACSSNGSSGEEVAQAPLAGTWRAAIQGSYDVSYKVLVDEYSAAVDDVIGAAGNPEVFTIGSALVRNIERTNATTLRAEVATITYGASSPFVLAPRWPTSVTYAVESLTYDEATGSWTSGTTSLQLSGRTAAQDPSDKPFGACEERSALGTNQHIYTCDYPVRAQTCSSFSAGDESHFWANTTCPRLGYDYQDIQKFGDWWNSSTSNATPGEYGFWGDKTGTTPLPIPNAPPESPEPGGGSGSGSGDCSNAWNKCPYDGQATPICEAACARTGTEREQTCLVLACFMESGNAGECCSPTCNQMCQ